MPRVLTPALRAVMGDWIYFVTTMRLADVAARISFAHEIHPNEELNELIQRRLNEGRAKKIAAYLQREDQRFFNALVVGVYGGDPCWYDFDDITPRQPDDVEIPADVQNILGFLSLTGSEKLFALDGQHRLAGIKQALAKNGADLGSEQVAVIFVAHRSGDDGLQRTRRLFTVLNKTAKPVLKGDIIALDEDDVMAICTRRLVNDCKYFNRGQVAMRLQNSLPPSDTTSWTTIAMLYDMLTILFRHIYPRCDDVPSKTLEQLKNERPSEDVLENYYKFATGYFELLANSFNEVRDVFEGGSPGEAVATFRHRDGGSVLFRPLGQRLFTQVIAELCASYTLEESFEWLSLVPTSLTDVPFADVIWNTGTRTMTSNKTDASIARDLLLYMLGEETRLKPETLRTRYAQYLGAADDQVRLPDRVVELK